MKTRQGVYVDSRERLCKWCDAPFRTVKPSELYCGDDCRRRVGLKVRDGESMSSERKKYDEVTVTCPVPECIRGPKARLAEHLRAEHSDADLLRLAEEVQLRAVELDKLRAAVPA